jgi:nucleoid-associated protein YgaU
MTRWGAWIAYGVLLLLPLQISAAEAGMTYDQYEKELALLQKREKNAKEQVAGEQAHVESLKSQNSEIAQKIEGLRMETLALLGSTENDVAAVQAEIASLLRQLEAVADLSPEDARKRSGDIGAVESRLSALKQKPVSLLWKIRDLLLAAEQTAGRAKALASTPPPPAPALIPAPVQTAQPPVSAAGVYTVRSVSGKHESLFQIAGHDSVLGDSKKWKILYDLNKEQINKQYQMYLKRNPNAKYLHPEDLIFPGQVLEIPR